MFLFRQFCNEHAEERMDEQGTGLYYKLEVMSEFTHPRLGMGAADML